MSGLSTARILQRDTHRLIPTKYSEGSEVARIAKDTRRIPGILDLDRAPHDRSVDGNDRFYGIGIDGLESGVSRSAIINAAFAHAKPQGGRFNLPNRGAWYAGFALETSKAEIAWRKSLYLHEIDRTEESVAYDDCLADFGGVFHDMRADPNPDVTKSGNLIFCILHGLSHALLENKRILCKL